MITLITIAGANIGSAIWGVVGHKESSNKLLNGILLVCNTAIAALCIAVAIKIGR